jgi:hypothetical protein
MKILGNRLEDSSSMVPDAGVFGYLLPIMTLIGFVLLAFDFGSPNFEKFLISVCAFSAGILFSRVLPVWREAKAEELERIKHLRQNGPAMVWVRLARQIGAWRALGMFVMICSILLIIAKVIW